MGMYKLFPVLLFACIAGLALGWASACTPGERAALATSCKQYLECDSNGQMVEKICGVDMSYDAMRKECRPSREMRCAKSTGCEAGRLYPDPESCRMYYSCAGGRLSRQICPVLHGFDQATGKCSYGFQCSRSKCLASERRPVAGDCAAYEICTGGKWARQSCAAGLSYSPLSGKCEPGPCVQCQQAAVMKGTACNRYQECDVGHWTEKECPAFHRFDPNQKKCVWYFQYTCPEDKNASGLMKLETCRNGDTRAEDDCSKYSICGEGKWDLMKCPEEYLFDSEKMQCVPSDEARCLSCPEDHASDQTCAAYYKCVKGKKIHTTCGFMKRWDGVTKKCVLMGAHCFPGDWCKEEGKRVPTNDCKFYQECLSGRYYKKACGFSKVFDAEKSNCVWNYPWAECKVSNYIRECIEGEKKLLDCTQYAKCVDGKWTHLHCNPGETFIKGECVKGECVVQKRSCSSYRINSVDLECVRGEVFDEVARKCVTGTCGKAKRSVSDCKDGEVRSVDKDCQSYEVCIGGAFVQKRCSDCMNFSPEEKMCKYVYNYPCKRLPLTTSAPVTPTQKQTTQPQPTTQKPTPQPQPTTQKPTPQPQPTTQKPTPQPQPTTQKPTPQPQPTTQKPTPQPQPTTQKPTAPTTQPPTCDEGTKKPNKTDCKKYYVCKNGKFIEDSCFWFRYFDSIELTCVFSGARCAK